MKNAQRTEAKLEDMIRVFSDEDLYYYSLFKAIYLYQSKDYINSFDIFSVLLKFNSLMSEAIALILEYMTRILYDWNSKMFLYQVDKVIEISNKHFNYERALEFEKLKLKFFLLNGIDSAYLNESCFIEEDSIKDVLELRELLSHNYDYEYENRFYYLIALFYKDPKAYVNESNGFEKCGYDCLYEYLIEYLKLKITNDPNIYMYLNMCLENSKKMNNYYFLMFFKSEIQNYLVANSKYKRYYEINRDVEEALKEMEVI